MKRSANLDTRNHRLPPALLVMLVLGTSPLTQSCGKPLPWHQATPEPRLQLASEATIREGLAIPGSYIVAFRSDLPSQEFSNRNFRREYQSHFLKLEALNLYEPGIENLHFLAGLNFSDAAYKPQKDWQGPVTSRLFWEGNPAQATNASIMRVDFTDNATAHKVLKSWEQDGRIYFAEPNYVTKPAAEGKSFATYATEYQGLVDSGQTPWFELIDLVAAYEALGEATENDPPIIAVMDSGFDYEHPDLVDNMFINANPNISGCADDTHGCNTTGSIKGFLGNGEVWPVGTDGPGEDCPNDITSECFHGTHVAGIIAAEPNPEANYGGICPRCQILPIRIVGPTKLEAGDAVSIADSSIIAALNYISRFETEDNKNAIRIVNASFGKFQRSRIVEHLVRLLRERGTGILVVAAAGNDDTQRRQFPAAFNDVIAVTNIHSENLSKAPSSNFGPWTDIAAPGTGVCDIGFDGIRSTVPGSQGQFCLPGTSMATPIVAGVAGLLLWQDPSLSTTALRDILLLTTDPVLYGDTTTNQVYYPKIRNEPVPVPLLGTGVINARRAVSYETDGGGRPHRSVNRVGSVCGSITSGPLLPQHLLVGYFIIPLVGLFTKSIRSRRKRHRQIPNKLP